MKEKDYIAATNLVKIRLARQLIQDILAVRVAYTDEQVAIQKILYNWEAICEKRLGL